jgi:hypothetical protein
VPFPLEQPPDGDWGTVRRNTDATAQRLNPVLPQARVYNSAAISTATGTPKILTFDSERYDNGGLHSTSANTGRLTATITGLHQIGCHVEFASNITGSRYVGLKVNGATYVAFDERQAVTVAGRPTIVTVSTSYQLAAGDYVEVEVFQNSGGNLNVNASGNYTPEFWIVRVGGYVNTGV